MQEGHVALLTAPAPTKRFLHERLVASQPRHLVASHLRHRLVASIDVASQWLLSCAATRRILAGTKPRRWLSESFQSTDAVRRRPEAGYGMNPEISDLDASGLHVEAKPISEAGNPFGCNPAVQGAQSTSRVRCDASSEAVLSEAIPEAHAIQRPKCSAMLHPIPHPKPSSAKPSRSTCNPASRVRCDAASHTSSEAILSEAIPEAHIIQRPECGAMPHSCRIRSRR